MLSIYSHIPYEVLTIFQLLHPVSNVFLSILFTNLLKYKWASMIILYNYLLNTL